MPSLVFAAVAWSRWSGPGDPAVHGTPLYGCNLLAWLSEDGKEPQFPYKKCMA